MEAIAKKYNLSKEQTVQRFLEITKESCFINEWFILDIADLVGLQGEELLIKKEIRLKVLESLVETPKNRLNK